MKLSLLNLVFVAVVGSLILMSGCIYDDLSSEIVVTEQICVSFTDYRESPELGSAVVCDRFKERILARISEYGADLEDIVSISVVSGTYHVTKPSKPDPKHDWTITAAVNVSRQDDPSGPVTDGPALFINRTSQSLLDAKGKPTVADMNSAGVEVINRALADLLEGMDPRLVLTMVDGIVDPAPTPEDPLTFKWNACVTFQAVVDMDLYNAGN